ncbi:MAG: glycosyltransferase family 9 protein [Chitinispirillaceae bacterium]|nr:glycosyltransferase family 9 protein [Chitinispirillaceae bacterium]
MKKRAAIKKVLRDFRRGCARTALKLLFRPLEQQPRFSGPLESAILFCQEKLGDAILFTPLITNLRRAFPDLSITVLAFGTAAARFFSTDPDVTAVYNVKDNRSALYRALGKHRFDLLYSPKDHLSFSAIFYARILRARIRVGVDHPLHHGFFNHLLRLEFLRPVIEKNCALLDYLGIEYAREQCAPRLPPHPLSGEVRSFLDSTNLKGAIGINLSAGEPDREWSCEKWSTLIRALDRKLVVFSMPQRQADKRMLETSFPQIIAAPATPTLFDAAAIMGGLDLLVSPDTSLIHAAACVNTPVVGLYRADKNHYARFSPYLIPHRMIISPTGLVEDISVDRVVEAVRALLAQGREHG